MNSTPESPTPWVVDTTAERFELDVIERSKVTPVVVDFWAAWCQPCRLLAPLLERLATELGGRFVLVRANTDELPQIAAQFQVQSIPAVFALVDGQVVDFFQGVLSESQLRTWLDRVLLAGTLVDAQAQESTRPSESERLYRQVLEQTPGHAQAKTGLARVLLDQGRSAESQALIEELEKRGFLEPEAEKVKAAITLASLGTADVAALRAAAAADPADLTAQLRLAEALAGQHAFEEALELCLQLVAQDKEGVGEQARQVMVGVFHVLPADSELTRSYRRRLSTLLF
ncbi:MAG: tetratricopeptide repeat protein [Planctomycetaceae bacterium]|nr:tetratricopeptide repeat protein [Planctomycetaceae bacterium]